MAQRLEEAERFSGLIASQIGVGETILKRIAQIATATKETQRAAPARAEQPTAHGVTRAAAEAAERLRELRQRGTEKAA